MGALQDLDRWARLERVELVRAQLASTAEVAFEGLGQQLPGHVAAQAAVHEEHRAVLALGQDAVALAAAREPGQVVAQVLGGPAAPERLHLLVELSVGGRQGTQVPPQALLVVGHVVASHVGSRPAGAGAR